MHLIDPASLAGLVHTFGYATIFLVIALESSGLPLPGEATLIAAAVYAASTHALTLPLIIATAACAAIMGDNLGFWIGRRFGFALLLRHGRRIGLGQDRLKLGQYLFARYGGSIVFFGRFITVLRALAAVLAGANHYPWRKFLLFNAAGGLVWSSLYASAAYQLGESVHRIAGPVSLVLLLVAGIVAAVVWRVFRRQEAVWQAAAEQAIPGPLSSSL